MSVADARPPLLLSIHSTSPGLKMRSVRAPSDLKEHAPRAPDPVAGTGDELIVSYADAGLPSRRLLPWVDSGPELTKSPARTRALRRAEMLKLHVGEYIDEGGMSSVARG